MGSCLKKPNQAKPNQQQKETSKIGRGLKRSINTSRTIIKDGESAVAYGQHGCNLSAGRGGRKEEERRTEQLCSEPSELDCTPMLTHRASTPSGWASQLIHTTKVKPLFYNAALRRCSLIKCAKAMLAIRLRKDLGQEHTSIHQSVSQSVSPRTLLPHKCSLQGCSPLPSTQLPEYCSYLSSCSSPKTTEVNSLLP